METQRYHDPKTPRHTAAPMDARLTPYLRATTDAEARRCLEHLLSAYASPVIDGILRRRWQICLHRRGSRETERETEALEARGEALINLIERLNGCRIAPDRHAIADLPGYAAATAFHSCDSRLRARCRERTRLQSRVRYCLTTLPGLDCWRVAAGAATRITVGGFAPWREESRVCAGGLALQRAERALLLLNHSPAVGVAEGGRAEMEALLHEVFRAADAPVALRDLVRLLARHLHIRERRIESLEGVTAEGTAAAVADPGPQAEIARTVEQRESLRRLWREVRLLPALQRAALLLNLRDDAGRGVLALLVLTQTATGPEVAASLGVADAEMEALWDRLPMEDALIAERLGVPRQRVINLRSAARKRLANRMAAYAHE